MVDLYNSPDADSVSTVSPSDAFLALTLEDDQNDIRSDVAKLDNSLSPSAVFNALVSDEDIDVDSFETSSSSSGSTSDAFNALISNDNNSDNQRQCQWTFADFDRFPDPDTYLGND